MTTSMTREKRDNIAKQHPEQLQTMVAFFDRWCNEVRPLMINEQEAVEKGEKLNG